MPDGSDRSGQILLSPDPSVMNFRTLARAHASVRTGTVLRCPRHDLAAGAQVELA